MRQIIILGGGLQALAVGDCLTKANCCVSVFSNEKSVLWSKYFTYKYSFSYDDEMSFYKILSNHSFDAVIPMGDKNAFFLSKNKEFIEKEFDTKCIVTNFDVFSIVYKKSLLMEFCNKNNIPHPHSISIDNSNIEKTAAIIGFPAMIKPDSSVGARGIVKVNNKQEIEANLQGIIQKYGSCSLQEYINNKEYFFNVTMYRTAMGEIVNHSIIKIVRFYPIGGGSSSCAISIEDNGIYNLCKLTLDKLNWHGLANFDILQDKKTQALKIIEINPRVPASLRGSSISNINFPAIMVADHLGLPVPQYDYQPGKVLRYLGLDILWFIKSSKRFCSKPSWFSFFGKDIFYQDIYMEDPSTWFSWLIEGIKKLFSN